MHNAHTGSVPPPIRYHERLSPSLALLVSSAIVVPMVALVLTPLNAALGVILGLAAGVALIALMVFLSPVVTVSGGELRAGRAHIPLDLLGDPEVLVGEDAREARGVRLRSDAWHLLRGGIDGIVRVPVEDPEDPVSQWVVSTRTPDRLAAAIVRGRTVR